MNLRELKKEVHDLRDVSKTVENFQKSWFSSIKNMPEEVKEKATKTVYEIKKDLEDLKHSRINQKLKHYSRYLIELKLTTLNKDRIKSKMIANTMLNDEFLKLKDTITDVKEFEISVKSLSKKYSPVNNLLNEKISLDESVSLMDLPHEKHLKNLIKTSKEQKRLVKVIGKEFVSLTKQTVLKNGI